MAFCTEELIAGRTALEAAQITAICALIHSVKLWVRESARKLRLRHREALDWRDANQELSVRLGQVNLLLAAHFPATGIPLELLDTMDIDMADEFGHEWKVPISEFTFDAVSVEEVA
jgi:hypothetical protein